MKKGVSSTVIGVIILVIGLAVMVGLLIYFSTIGKSQVGAFIDMFSFIKRGE